MAPIYHDLFISVSHKTIKDFYGTTQTHFVDEELIFVMKSWL